MSEMFIRRSFSEFADLQAGLQTLRVNGVATEPEAFCGSISGMHFPDVAVEIVRTGPALLFGGSEQARAGYLLVLDGTEGAKLDGRECKRAASLVGYLVSQGVNPNLLSAQCFGATHPVGPNDTPEGQAKNRRVAITLTGDGT